MSQNRPLAKNKGPPYGSPFASTDWRLLGSHTGFDVSQRAVDTSQYALFTDQRHHGVDARGEITPDR